MAPPPRSSSAAVPGPAAVAAPEPAGTAAPPPSPPAAVLPAEAVERAVDRLLRRHGAAQAERIRRGVEQVAARWWPEDGDAEDLCAFCEAAFQSDPAELERSFRRLEQVMEQVDGHLLEVRRELMEPIEVDRGPAAPATAVDALLVHLDLAPPVDDDLFRDSIAGFACRVPAAATQAANRVATAAEEYVSTYNMRLDRLLTASGERPFPEGLRLISHWGLRDQLASHYAAPDAPGALARQRLILRVMERIVRQEIPAAVIDNSDLLWEPERNTVRPGPPELAAREPDRR